MARSSEVAALLDEGFVPSGAKPKVRDPITGEASYQSSNIPGRMLKALVVYQQEQQAMVQRRMEDAKKRSDMYKTLRDAGYDPKRAHKAVVEMQFPTEEGEKPAKERKTEAEIGKLQAQTKKLLQGGGNYKENLALWKQAEKEVFMSLGGSDIAGLDEANKAKYFPAIQERYKELKGELGVGDAEPGKKDARTLYNEARAAGKSVEEAKRIAGIS